MSKLDLSKFKKLSSTKDFTVMKHPDGHTINIAHKALGPEMKKHLDGLPHYDDGGGVPYSAKAGAEVSSGVQGKKVEAPKQHSGAGESQGYSGDIEEASKAEKPIGESSSYSTYFHADGGEVKDAPKKTVGQMINYPGAEEPKPEPSPKANYDDGGSVNVQDIVKLAPLLAAMAKGGEVKDPTQRHLLPGDSIPNAIEKNVVKNASHRMAKGGSVHVKQAPIPNYSKNIPHFADGTPDEPISSQQPAPTQDPTAGMPNVTPDTSATPQVAGGDSELQAKRAAYNQMVADKLGGGKYAEGKGQDPTTMENIQAAQFGPNGEPPANFNADVWQQSAANYNASQQNELAAKQQATAQMAQNNQARVSAGLDPIPITSDMAASVTSPTSGGTPDNSVPTTPQTPPDAAIPGDKELTALQAGRQAVNSANPGAPAHQPATSAPGQSPQDTQQKLVAAKQLTFDALMHERQQMLSQMKDADPLTMGKIFDDKTWHGKIGMLAGLMLGGGAGAVLGTGNNVASMYQSMIDNNLKAQQLNMGQRQNLMANNMQLMGNVKDAVALSKLQMNDLMMHKLVQLAAKYPNNPQIQQNLQAMGMMGMQSSSSIMDTLAANQAWRHSVDHIQDPGQKIQFNPVMTPEQKNEAFKQLGTYQNMNAARSNLLNAFDKVDKMALAGSFSPHQRDALLQPLLAQTVKDSEGRITPQDVPMIGALFPSATDVGKNTRAIKRAQLAKFVSEKMNFPMLQLAGVNVNTPQVGVQAGPPKLGK